MIRAVLTDIEGTTSSIGFVTDILFPYARARLSDYVMTHQEELAPLLATVPGDAVTTLLTWSDADAKQTALKDIQGRIWAEGYANGSLSGHVYPDAAEALRRWHAADVKLAVFSSGSIRAQKLIFEHSDQGNLAPLFSWWFDTTTGPKREASSYTAISAAMEMPPGEILFLSDMAAEVDAAKLAGMQTLLIDRQDGHGDIVSFGEIKL